MVDIAVINRLKHQLEQFTLTLFNAPHVMRELKKETVCLCQLTPAQIKNLPDDNDLIGLREVLLNHVTAYLAELEGV